MSRLYRFTKSGRGRERKKERKKKERKKEKKEKKKKKRKKSKKEKDKKKRKKKRKEKKDKGKKNKKKNGSVNCQALPLQSLRGWGGKCGGSRPQGSESVKPFVVDPIGMSDVSARLCRLSTCITLLSGSIHCTRTQDGHLDFHTPPELGTRKTPRCMGCVCIYIYIYPQQNNQGSRRDQEEVGCQKLDFFRFGLFLNSSATDIVFVILPKHGS